ncbi:MAG: hypothetical protein GX196_03445 [Clostridiaceae bacterium]|nr:hypothetical protein [Clostridiaceae bacterium]
MKLYKALLPLLMVLIMASCVKSPDLPKEQKESEGKYYTEFTSMIPEAKNPKELFSYIDQHAGDIPRDDFTKIIIAQINYQDSFLKTFEENYFSQSVQEILYNVLGNDTSKIENGALDIENKEVADLVKATYEYGYRIDMSEGMYFPILDYGVYKKYKEYLNEDALEFIEILSAESDKVPLKDAALVIPYEEVLNRAIRCESFLKKYPGFEGEKFISDLFEKYQAITFYGSNNTPLFDYGTKEMNEKAKEAYQSFVKSIGNENSEFKKNLRLFLEVLAKNGYKLTGEVDDFRDIKAPIKY